MSEFNKSFVKLSNALMRKIVQERLPSVRDVYNAIKECSETKKTRGISGSNVKLNMTMEQMVEKLSKTVSYHGGYIYHGTKIKIVQQNVSSELACRFNHSVKKHDVNGTDLKEYVTYVKSKLSDTSAISINYYTDHENFGSDRWLRREDTNTWVHVFSYSRQKEINEPWIKMYAGMRQDVAKMLSCKLTNTFHQYFDKVLEGMDAYYRGCYVAE